MPISLTVINPFSGYEIGESITDARLVKEYSDSHAGSVVRVGSDWPPADPAPTPTPILKG